MSKELSLVDQVEEQQADIIQNIESRIAEASDTDRDLLSQAVRNNYKEIVQSLIASAKGMWVEKTVVNKNGVEIQVPVYQEKPDTIVGQYLLNQLVGKPKETQITEGRVVFVRDF